MNRVRDRQINFRVNEQEWQQLQRSASNVAMSVPAYCKQVALRKKFKPPLIDKQGAIAIAAELRRIGVNVNQIARSTNQGQNANKSVLEALQKELANLWLLLSSELQKAQTD